MAKVIHWRCTIAVPFNGDLHFCMSKITTDMEWALDGHLLTDYVYGLPKAMGVYNITVVTRVHSFEGDVDWDSTITQCEQSNDFIDCVSIVDEADPSTAIEGEVKR